MNQQKTKNMAKHPIIIHPPSNLFLKGDNNTMISESAQIQIDQQRVKSSKIYKQLEESFEQKVRDSENQLRDMQSIADLKSMNILDMRLNNQRRMRTIWQIKKGCIHTQRLILREEQQFECYYERLNGGLGGYGLEGVGNEGYQFDQ